MRAYRTLIAAIVALATTSAGAQVRQLPAPAPAPSVAPSWEIAPTLASPPATDVSPSTPGMMGLQGAQGYQAVFKDAVRTRGAAPATAIASVIAAFQRGDFATAKAQVDRLIGQLASDTVRRAAAVDFRGLIYQRQGRLTEATDSHREAIDLLEQALRDDDGLPAAAETLLNAKNNLAVAHYLRGDYKQAATLLSDVIDTPKLNLVMLARALNNRGLVHQALGGLDKARLDFDKAASAAGPDKTVRAQALNNQARVYGAEGNAAYAVSRLQEARTLARESGDAALEANILDSWGEVLLGARQYRAAAARLDEARRIEAKVQAPVVKVAIATNRGRALAGLGRPTEALAAFAEAVKLAGDLELSALERAALAFRAEVHARAGRLDEAITDYKQAVEIVEETRGRLLRETEADFVRASQDLYEALARLLLKRRAPGDSTEALAYVDRSRSATLRRELLALNPELRDEDLKRQLGETRDLLLQEAALASYLQQELAAAAPREDVAARIRERLQAVRRDVRAAIDELSARYPAYREYVAVDPLTFGDLTDRLPAGHLIVAFFPADDALYIFLISRQGGVQFRQVPKVTKRELDRKIREYRELVTKGALDRSFLRIDAWTDRRWEPLRTLTVWLYDALLKPIATELAQAEHIIFAPTGLLYYLPLHALGPFDRRTGEVRFVILDKPVSYLTSTTLLKVALGPVKPRHRSLLALANPPFQDARFKPLQYAEQEVSGLKELFGENALVLPGAQATYKALLALLGAPEGGASRGADRPFGFVHLATHGVIDPAAPEESFLALDGTNKLVVREIPRLVDLRDHEVNLVTLSACETALGPESPKATLMSLATVFNWAGAPSVVVSLWSVDDLATRDLMIGFYGGLVKQATLDKARALQQAQRTLASKPETRHPFFWAPFILIGDWR